MSERETLFSGLRQTEVPPGFCPACTKDLDENGWCFECHITPGDNYYCAACDGFYGSKRHVKLAHPKPGPFRWRQRRWWSWLVGQMYALGIIAGSVHSGHEGGWIVHGLHWRGSRPYILYMHGYTWGRVPLWHRLRRGHWPETVYLGMCGVCAPWQCCGATGFDHAEGCPDAY